MREWFKKVTNYEINGAINNNYEINNATKLTDCGANERRRIADRPETFALDKRAHVSRQFVKMSPHVVLENEAAQ